MGFYIFCQYASDDKKYQNPHKWGKNKIFSSLLQKSKRKDDVNEHKGGERMNDLEECEHNWIQTNLASIKFADVLYLGNGRMCNKCQMFMAFNLVEATSLLQ